MAFMCHTRAHYIISSAKNERENTLKKTENDLVECSLLNLQGNRASDRFQSFLYL